MGICRKAVRVAVAAIVTCTTLGAVSSFAGAATTTTMTGRFLTFPAGRDMGLDVTGSASLRRTKHATVARVVVRGLTPGTVYAAHVHNQPCSDNMAGGHYRDDPGGPAAPPNELWLSSSTDPTAGIVANSHTVARGRGSAPWVARDDAVAIVIHFIPTGGNTSGGPKVACADLG